MKCIVIDIDTVRADHLSCYGYGHETSPNIDRLAGDGTLFEQFIAANIPTQPAHTTIYSGQHAVTHGIAAHGSSILELPPDTPWLPTLLNEAGILTAAIDNLAAQKPWFGAGYVEYIDLPRYLMGMHSAEQVVNYALPWLERHVDDDFFLFLHPWDPHSPYDPPGEYREAFYNGRKNDPGDESLDAWRSQVAFPFFEKRWPLAKYGEFTDIDYLRALYDGEIAHADEHIGRLLEALDDLGIAEDTLVILTSDHGEIMYAHDGFFDHAGLYDANVRVPLIVRGPGVKQGGSQSGLAQHADLAPTILGHFGLAVPTSMDGSSLWPAMRGDCWEGCESVYLSEATWQAKWGVRTKRWKLIKVIDAGIHGGDCDELYDLQADPQEAVNLAQARPEVVDALELQLVRWRDQKLGARPDPVRLQASAGLPVRQWMRRRPA